MTTIVIVRHGTTEWMEEGRLHGRLDSRLSARGKREARLVGQHLARQGTLDALYTSPSGRAVETAAIIAEEIGIEPVIIEGLREMDFGWLEGRGVESSVDDRISLWHKLRWAILFPIGLLTGESWPRTKQRVAEALDQVLGRHPKGRVLLVAHGGTHSAILNTLLRDGEKRRMPWYPLAPCGITEIETGSDGRAALASLNQTGHLP